MIRPAAGTEGGTISAPMIGWGGRTNRKETTMTRLVVLGCFAYLAVGLGQLVAGTVMEPMVQAYGIRYASGGQLVLHQFAGGLAGTLSVPWLTGRIGRKGLLLAALGMMIAAETVYLMQPPWAVMLAVAPVAGFGFGATETLVGSFIIRAAGAQANVAMSRVEVFFGIGALLMPFVGAALIDAGVWRASFGFVAVMSAVALWLWARYWPDAPFRSADAPGGGSSGKVRPSAGTEASRAPERWRIYAALTACSLFFYLYVGLEMSFAHYLPSLLVQDNGLGEAQATLYLSAFWGAMVIGRLAAGHLADRWGNAAYLLTVCLGTAICFAAMAAWPGPASTLVLTVAAGLAMSGMFAVALVLADRAAPGMTERTTSLMLACGLIGGGTLPKVSGWLFDRSGPDAARWLLAALALALLLVMVWAALSASRARQAAHRAERPAAG